MGVLKNQYLYAHAMCSFTFFVIQEDFSFMAPALRRNLQVWRRKHRRLFLAFFWTCGILFGIWISFLAGSSSFSLMRGAPGATVSINALLLTATLPFLLSALAVFLSGPEWLLPVSLVCGFLYGYIGLLVFRTFGSAGWLIRPMLCFSICASAPLLFLYWQCLFASNRKMFLFETFFFLSCAVLIASFDYSHVSPFLASLIF